MFYVAFSPHPYRRSSSVSAGRCERVPLCASRFSPELNMLVNARSTVFTVDKRHSGRAAARRPLLRFDQLEMRRSVGVPAPCAPG
jgi:hypothetical protein